MNTFNNVINIIVDIMHWYKIDSHLGWVQQLLIFIAVMSYELITLLLTLQKILGNVVLNYNFVNTRTYHTYHTFIHIYSYLVIIVAQCWTDYVKIHQNSVNVVWGCHLKGNKFIIENLSQLYIVTVNFRNGDHNNKFGPKCYLLNHRFYYERKLHSR